MNLENKKKVSGKLADEGLYLIWLGIQQWRQNTLVLKMGQSVFAIKFPTQNCQVGFAMRRKKKHNNSELNQ